MVVQVRVALEVGRVVQRHRAVATCRSHEEVPGGGGMSARCRRDLAALSMPQSKPTMQSTRNTGSLRILRGWLQSAGEAGDCEQQRQWDSMGALVVQQRAFQRPPKDENGGQSQRVA